MKLIKGILKNLVLCNVNICDVLRDYNQKLFNFEFLDPDIIL